MGYELVVKKTDGTSHKIGFQPHTTVLDLMKEVASR